MPDHFNTLADARQLSSGTIATLTGLRSYATIEQARASFVEFVESEIEAGRMEPDMPWNVAWLAFESASLVEAVAIQIAKDGGMGSAEEAHEAAITFLRNGM